MFGHKRIERCINIICKPVQIWMLFIFILILVACNGSSKIVRLIFLDSEGKILYETNENWAEISRRNRDGESMNQIFEDIYQLPTDVLNDRIFMNWYLVTEGEGFLVYEPRYQENHLWFHRIYYNSHKVLFNFENGVSLVKVNLDFRDYYYDLESEILIIETLQTKSIYTYINESNLILATSFYYVSQFSTRDSDFITVDGVIYADYSTFDWYTNKVMVTYKGIIDLKPTTFESNYVLRNNQTVDRLIENGTIGELTIEDTKFLYFDYNFFWDSYKFKYEPYKSEFFDIMIDYRDDNEPMLVLRSVDFGYIRSYYTISMNKDKSVINKFFNKMITPSF